MQLQQEKQKEEEENQQRSKQTEPIQNNLEQNQQIKTFQPPPFLERLHQPRPSTPLPQFDVLDELRNVYIKIPLLQATKDIPIYTKAIKELCLKKPAKKRFDPKTIHVIADHSKVIPKGVLEDIIVSLDSWEYPVDFLVLQPKSNLGGNPIILGRPWLATADAFIGCRSGNMIISRGTKQKQLTLYPSAQAPTVTHNLWLDDKYNDQEEIYSVLSINQMYDIEENNNADLVEMFISQPEVSEELRNEQYIAVDYMLAQSFQETHTMYSLKAIFDEIFPINSITNTQSKTIEISPGKTLNIGAFLETSQEQKLIHLLNKYQKEFAWDYTDMQGIHPETCTHHIYTDTSIQPLRQPQRRMNPMLKEIVRDELQKLLKVKFIYPIFYSQWVSPLVMVPKKNDKWGVCVDYRELNKATLKDYFPLPFINQVLDTLAGKKSFSFLDGFSGYNQINIASGDQDKTTFTYPWGTYAYNVLPFGLCNALATFQRAALANFADLVHECVEVYMDDFSIYGDSFDHSLQNLEKFYNDV
eukprot:PITA_27327